jgi:uncharacterized C2H2 Zn-finger protein
MKSRTCTVCRAKRKLLEDEHVCPDCQLLRKYRKGVKKHKAKANLWRSRRP